MKFSAITACLLLCHGFAAATQEQPPQVRVCLQYLSLAHSDLSELLSAELAKDTTLHERAFALVKDGRAKLLESSLIVCRSGERAILESVREEIYPTEYEPPEIPPDGTQPLMQFPIITFFERATYTAFEIRNVGVSLEVDPTVISPDLIELRLVPSMVHHLRTQTWMEHTDVWGKSDIGFPIYEGWHTNTTIGLKPGKFTHIAVFTPKRPLPVSFADPRILLFVRADLLATDGER